MLFHGELPFEFMHAFVHLFVVSLEQFDLIHTLFKFFFMYGLIVFVLVRSIMHLSKFNRCINLYFVFC